MIILKSSSPRRKQILTDLGLNFSIIPPMVEETPEENEASLDFLKRVTFDKLETGSALPGNLYIASDTIVVLDGQLLQKPLNEENAVEILSRLSGRENRVYSSVGIYNGSEMFYDYDETLVRFKNWNRDEILHYVRTHHVLDKAGAYAIQDSNGPVSEFSGSYSNVMGFPLRKFYRFHPLWSRQ